MQIRKSSHCSLVAAAACAMGLLWPSTAAAQTVAGHARAVQATTATLLGLSTTMLADTGTLGGSTDARDASQLTGSIPGLLSGDALHATTIGWPDQVASEASIGAVTITVGGNTISAGFVQARATSTADGNTGAVNIDSLSINGLAIDVSGSPNQTIAIPGGGIVINEQTASAGGIQVNALRIVIDGTADVIIASARANAQ